MLGIFCSQLATVLAESALGNESNDACVRLLWLDMAGEPASWSGLYVVVAAGNWTFGVACVTTAELNVAATCGCGICALGML